MTSNILGEEGLPWGPDHASPVPPLARHLGLSALVTCAWPVALALLMSVPLPGT